MSNETKNISTTLVVPAFGKSPELKLEMKNVREAENRLHEAKTVNPVTYVDLEFCFNEAYRDLRRHLASVGYAITLAEKAAEEAKADVILGSYAEFMAGKPKSHDNSDMRSAFLTRDPNYTAALDRVAQLKALESNLDGKIKVMEKTCAYMKKQIDLVMRSGLANSNLYITNKK